MTDSLKIDSQQGTIYLTNGFVVSAEVTPAQILASPVDAKPYNLSALPFSWFSAQGGTINSTPLLVEFCFWGELLVHADLHLDLEQGKRKRIKAMQERLLERELGAPHQITEEANRFQSLPALVYQYPWGNIASLSRDNTFIRIEFAGRRQAASATFSKFDTKDHLSAVQQFKNRLLGSV